MTIDATVTPASDPFRTVSGRFYRAVDPRYADAALSGSRSAGRYSRPTEPTLYLSSSRAGVDAAMIAHRDARTADLGVREFAVSATRIVDLRERDLLLGLGVDPDDAAAPWQDVVARGEEPPSWRVRDRLIALGAHGLIDPSRKAPGLWHLVLFDWGQSSVRFV